MVDPIQGWLNAGIGNGGSSGYQNPSSPGSGAFPTQMGGGAGSPASIMGILQRVMSGMGGQRGMNTGNAMGSKPLGISGGGQQSLQGIMQLLQQLMGGMNGGSGFNSGGLAGAPGRATWQMGMQSPSMGRIY